MNILVEKESIQTLANTIKSKANVSEKVSLQQLNNIVNNYTGSGGVDIPKVFINGTIPTTKDDVNAELIYISKSINFKAYIAIKCQGTSSMRYPKKNFTIKLFKDAEHTEKLKIGFNNWGEQNKFCLKANWIDISHAPAGLVSEFRQGESISSNSTGADIANADLHEAKIVYRKQANGTITISRCYNNNGQIHTNNKQVSYVAVPQNLRLGCYQTTLGGTGRYAKGIMNDCIIYNYALSDDEVRELLLS